VAREYQLERLPRSVARLKGLQSISVYQAPIDRWPEELNGLNMLERIDLGGTGITEIPAGAVKSLRS